MLRTHFAIVGGCDLVGDVARLALSRSGDVLWGQLVVCQTQRQLPWKDEVRTTYWVQSQGQGQSCKINIGVVATWVILGQTLLVLLRTMMAFGSGRLTNSFDHIRRYMIQQQMHIMLLRFDEKAKALCGQPAWTWNPPCCFGPWCSEAPPKRVDDKQRIRWESSFVANECYTRFGFGLLTCG